MTGLLPAAYVAGCGAALGWLLRRYFDPLPWRVWVAFALALGALYSPVLVGDRLLLPLDGLRGQAPFGELAPTEPPGNPLQGDLLTLIAPLQAAVRGAYARGEWPLWHAQAGAGMPLLADPQAQGLQPLIGLAAVFPLERAAGVAAVLRVLCALVFTFLFLRRHGLGEPAALAGALAYGLGGFVQLWLGWPIASAAALLPFGLYAVTMVADRGARRDTALLAIATFAIFAAGQPEGMLYALGGVGLLLAVRLREAHIAGPVARRRLLIVAGGALLIGSAAAAPLVLSELRYLPATERAAERLAAAAAPATQAGPPRLWLAEWGGRTLGRWLPIAAPNVFGNSRYADASGLSYWGPENTNEDAAGFAGTLALFAVLTGVGARRRLPRERWAWLALAGALVILALPPALAALLRGVPLWQMSATGHHRLLLVVAFCLAWLGACGIERARGGEVPWRVLGIAAAMLGMLLVWATFAYRPAANPVALWVLRRGTLLLQLKILAAGLVLLVAASRARIAAWGAAALVAGELALIHGPANPPAPAASLTTRQAWLPTPEPLAMLLSSVESDRDDRAAGMIALGPALPANLPALWGLRDARIYNPAAPAAYVRLLRPILAAPEDGRAVGAPNHPLYDLLGVRFVLTAPGQAAASSRLVADTSAGRLYERPRPLPLLSLPPSWSAAPLPPDELAARRANYASHAWLYGAPGVAPGAGQGGELVYRKLGKARVRAGVSVAMPRVFATRIFQDGGWRLLVDGARRPTFRANGPFLAAGLLPEDRVLDLLYRPPGFVPGMLIAALGIAAALGWWTPPPRHHAPIGRPRRIEEGGFSG